MVRKSHSPESGRHDPVRVKLAEDEAARSRARDVIDDVGADAPHDATSHMQSASESGQKSTGYEIPSSSGRVLRSRLGAHDGRRVVGRIIG